MPAAMHLTVLVSLFAVTFCENATFSTTKEQMVTTTSAARSTTLTSIKTNDTSLSAVPTTNTTQQPSTTKHEVTTAATPESVSSAAPLSVSTQTANRTEETHPTPFSQTAATNQTSNGTVSHASTLPPGSESSNITSPTTTSSGHLDEWGKDALAANPGLVAILCIFCIILVLVVVVFTVKCVQSPRSNFERLEDVPMGKVNEESPFAQYSK